MDIYTVIVRPLVTEKTEGQKEEGKYAFKVHSRANKNEIKRAVEGIYDVDVTAVNVMNVPAKINRRRGRRPTVRHPAWKKAIVTLVPGQRIEDLEA